MLVAIVIAVSASGTAHAQRRSAVTLSAQAIPLVTRVDPGIGGRTLTEGYLSQPVLMANGSLGGTGLSARLTLNFEGLTLDRGELDTGAYGEGYIDRRHPHTYLHELLGITQRSFGSTRVSVVAGKGFAPFGTDDPMMRPFEKYPVNHHQAQILERYVAIAALGVANGRLIGEAGVFNGDEPTGAGTAPDASRFGDSWSARVTARPFGSTELSASYAKVASPEFREGLGLDQEKLSAAWRWSRDARAGLTYAFVEWTRSDELAGSHRAFRFSSVLAEATSIARGTVVSVRVERTTRPEEERLANPFRTARPVADFSLIGITRWQSVTAHLERPLRATASSLTFAPFIEIARLRPTQDLRPSAFEPPAFYGADQIWSLSAGMRVSAGAMPHRMGRYGAAAMGDARDMAHGHR